MRGPGRGKKSTGGGGRTGERRRSDENADYNDSQDGCVSAASGKATRRAGNHDGAPRLHGSCVGPRRWMGSGAIRHDPRTAAPPTPAPPPPQCCRPGGLARRGVTRTTRLVVIGVVLTLPFVHLR